MTKILLTMLTNMPIDSIFSPHDHWQPPLPSLAPPSFHLAPGSRSSRRIRSPSEGKGWKSPGDPQWLEDIISFFPVWGPSMFFLSFFPCFLSNDFLLIISLVPNIFLQTCQRWLRDTGDKWLYYSGTSSTPKSFWRENTMVSHLNSIQNMFKTMSDPWYSGYPAEGSKMEITLEMTTIYHSSIHTTMTMTTQKKKNDIASRF